MTSSASLWRHGDFMKLWGAQSISLLGSHVTALALPLTAILLLDASAFEVGLLATLQYLPFLLIGLPAGAIVDRLRRLPVLIVADVVRFLLLMLVPIAAAVDRLHMALLYPVAFGVGVLTVLFDVAHQSYLPSLVGRHQIVDGNTKLQLSYSGAQLTGPGVGGVLVQVLTAPLAILVDALTYVVSAVLLLTIRQREPAATGGTADLRGLVKDVREGLRFVLRHGLIRPLAMATAAANFFYLFGMTGAVLTLYAVRDLHLSPAMLGLVLATGNAGAVLGSLASGSVLRLWRLGPVLVVTSLVSALAILLILLASPGNAVVVIAIAVFVGEFGITIYDISQLSLRQAATPSHLQGRMNATVRFLIWGSIPVGAFLGGVLGQWVGLREVLWIAAVGSLLPAIPLLLSRVRGLRDIDSAVADELAPAGAAGD